MECSARYGRRSLNAVADETPTTVSPPVAATTDEVPMDDGIADALAVHPGRVLRNWTLSAAVIGLFGYLPVGFGLARTGKAPGFIVGIALAAAVGVALIVVLPGLLQARRIMRQTAADLDAGTVVRVAGPVSIQRKGGGGVVVTGLDVQASVGTTFLVLHDRAIPAPSLRLIRALRHVDAAVVTVAPRSGMVLQVDDVNGVALYRDAALISGGRPRWGPVRGGAVTVAVVAAYAGLAGAMVAVAHHATTA